MAEIIHDKYDLSCWHVVGAVTYDSVMALTEEGYALLSQASVKHCTIDFSGLSDFNSALLSMILCWYRRAVALGIRLSVKSAPALACQMAVTYGLDFLLENT